MLVFDDKIEETMMKKDVTDAELEDVCVQKHYEFFLTLEFIEESYKLANHLYSPPRGSRK